MSRNRKAREFKTHPLGKAFIEDLNERMKALGVGRPERHRRISALTRGEETPEQALEWAQSAETVKLPKRVTGKTDSVILLPAGVKVKQGFHPIEES